jgi:hypothetical protein
LLLTGGVARWLSWLISRDKWLNLFGPARLPSSAGRDRLRSVVREEIGGGQRFKRATGRSGAIARRARPYFECLAFPPRPACLVQLSSTDAGSGILHHYTSRGDEQQRAGIHCGQLFEGRMIDCRIGLAGGDVVRRNNHRDVPLDFCPMQRLVMCSRRSPVAMTNRYSVPARFTNSTTPGKRAGLWMVTYSRKSAAFRSPSSYPGTGRTSHPS